MKFCYLDESGMGSEPYLLMVGVIVDSHRMHMTKETWSEFLTMLSKTCGREISEFHTREFYAGNGPWRAIDGPGRAKIISRILDWWGARKHHIIFTAIDKTLHKQMLEKGELLQGMETPWRTAALHLCLTIQKAHQTQAKTKGHTLLLFDRETTEESQLSKLISFPPQWTDGYYGRTKKQIPLDQIIDVPFFGDSEDILLLQVADLITFILRRYAEIAEKKDTERYPGEFDRLSEWIAIISSRAYHVATRYPRRGTDSAQILFNALAPNSIKGIE